MSYVEPRDACDLECAPQQHYSDALRSEIGQLYLGEIGAVSKRGHEGSSGV